MARSGDSSYLPARRDDGSPSIFWQVVRVFVPALLHGSHVPAKRFHAGRKKTRIVVLAVGLPVTFAQLGVAAYYDKEVFGDL